MRFMHYFCGRRWRGIQRKKRCWTCRCRLVYNHSTPFLLLGSLMADELNKEELSVTYIKSNHFRVVHADGMFGGPTPRGLIHMDIYSERQPIPQQAVYKVAVQESGEGLIGEEIRERRITRETNVVREVELGIVLDVNVAKSLMAWLAKMVNAIEQQKADKE